MIADLQHQHDQRVAADPDYQEMVSEIATLEEVRTQKMVSLNLEKRRTERTARHHGDLTGEEERQAALSEEVDADTDVSEERPDAVLGEAAQLTADLVQLEPRYLAGAKTGG